MTELKPTVFLRYVLRHNMKILQQWWTSGKNYSIPENPDGCIGEWCDVEMEPEE